MDLELTKLKVKILGDELPMYKIAAECGIHPSTLTRYSLGQQDFTQKHLLKLCAYFECEADELVGWVAFELED